ncbi:TRAP transporter permease [Roseibium salinum]|uniref:TRAP transporter fused permease subunit n=1 Tax=Roseibium salinum TaxID=1604349 RepID=A0ABT3QVL1_9HYPH|nr:TRAP transporter fused permease subunit [Roseibium sp. DSM 29163]MCX2720896.1 TRAP transporter fused permease subunit [Roseibium sp. DSM 29163]
MLTIEKGLSYVVTVVAIGLSLWHLAIVAGFLTYSTLDIRILHLTVLLALVFLVRLPRDNSVENGASPKRAAFGLSLRVVCALIAVGAGLYTYFRWRPIAFSGGVTTDLDARVGLVMIALVLIAVSRRIGLFLSLIAVVFLLYPFVSSYLPEVISTRGYGWERVSIFLATGGEGIFGIPLGVSASYIIIFTIFGAFLNNFGAGDFFFQLAHSLTRGARAASAKTAVIFSTLLGMISGSAAGNVAVTGTMTIPMMKREGYTPNQAAAIEAVVSTGGQIMPPIMGAAAFIMAEIIGRPYSEVMTAALIPALLFFSSIFFIVHLQAVKVNLPRTEAASDAPPLRRSLLAGTRFMVPFFTLIGMMLAGYSPFRASFIALILLLVGCTLYEWRDLRGVLHKTLKSLEDGALAVLSIAVACAAAGIVAGVLSMTGLGSKISSLIIVLAAGEPLLALAMTAVLAIILGMGLPTTAAYLILATVVAPPLVQMGVPLLTAHMFVFFFGCISTITPPVALASYVAAGIAGSDINRTSWTAFTYGITSYILPFMFFFSPALLMQGSGMNVTVAVMTGLLAVFCISSAVVGYFRRSLNQIGRGAMALSGLLLIYQEQTSSVIALLMLTGVALVIQFGGPRVALLVAK